MEKIRVFGLNRLDSMDLKRQFPDADITFEAPDPNDPNRGELVTAALIVLGFAGIQALATWLLRTSKHGKIRHKIQTINSRGERHTEEFEMDVTESTSRADVVEALGKVMKFDPSVLKEPSSS